jgi:hypothetical protein
VTNNRIRWYGHVSRISKERISRMVYNMKVKGKHPRRRPRSRWEHKVRKYVTQKEGRKKLRSCGKMDRLRLGCQTTHLKWKLLRKKKKMIH